MFQNCSSTANNSGTNPQFLTNSHSVCLTKHHCYCPALWNQPCSRYIWLQTRSQQHISIPGKNLLLFWRARLTKTYFKKTERGKETRDQRKSSSKIRLQKNRQSGPSDANVSVIRNEHQTKTVIIILRLRQLWGAQCTETGEENSDIDVEWLYCSGLYTRDRCGEKWTKFTKLHKSYREQCSGIDDWKTFLCFFPNTD